MYDRRSRRRSTRETGQEGLRGGWPAVVDVLEDAIARVGGLAHVAVGLEGIGVSLLIVENVDCVDCDAHGEDAFI